MKTAFTPLALFIALLAACTPANAAAREMPPSTRPAAVEISVQPAAFPEPALTYALLPDTPDRTPGDAAPLYLMAFMHLKLDASKIDPLLDAPHHAFPVDEAQALLSPYRASLALVEIATRRTQCNWNVPYREQGFAALLPFLSPARDATRLLCLAARIEMAQGHFDDALHTLQTGFAMADHLFNDAVLVQGLVGVGITNLLLERVHEFIETPGAPNLYWALAALPHGGSQMRAMAEKERSWLELMAPELRRHGSRPIVPADIFNPIRRMHHLMTGETSSPIAEKLQMAGLVALSDAPARAWLATHSYAPQQVKDMSSEQAVGIYFLESYRCLQDDMTKWSALPYWQAQAGYHRGSEELAQAKNSNNPLIMLLPAMSGVHRTIVLTDRHIALLEIVEALRGYAAAHEGKLPASLSDLSESPAPMDPMTGKEFAYEVSGNTAIVRSLAIALREGETSGLYRITLRAGK